MKKFFNSYCLVVATLLLLASCVSQASANGGYGAAAFGTAGCVAPPTGIPQAAPAAIDCGAGLAALQQQFAQMQQYQFSAQQSFAPSFAPAQSYSYAQRSFSYNAAPALAPSFAPAYAPQLGFAPSVYGAATFAPGVGVYNRGLFLNRGFGLGFGVGTYGIGTGTYGIGAGFAPVFRAPVFRSSVFVPRRTVIINRGTIHRRFR